MVAAAIVAGIVAALAFVRRVVNPPPAIVVIRDPAEPTIVDRATGAVTSIQAAEVTLPAETLEQIWAPEYLERLARTYWRFLTRFTLGFVRVYYTPSGRYVCLLTRRLPLLTFGQPEYEMDAQRGIVRWRIERGVLVAPKYRGHGHLKLDVQRRPPPGRGRGRVYVEVEVANFYPAIAFGISQWFYKNTQSRIHVLATHGFLRSLKKMKLAQSRVGRLVELTVDQVPDPPPARQEVAA
jgi:GNAT superfamily N-acetyltransferase